MTSNCHSDCLIVPLGPVNIMKPARHWRWPADGPLMVVSDAQSGGKRCMSGGKGCMSSGKGCMSGGKGCMSGGKGACQVVRDACQVVRDACQVVRVHVRW